MAFYCLLWYSKKQKQTLKGKPTGISTAYHPLKTTCLSIVLLAKLIIHLFINSPVKLGSVLRDFYALFETYFDAISIKIPKKRSCIFRLFLKIKKMFQKNIYLGKLPTIIVTLYNLFWTLKLKF